MTFCRQCESTIVRKVSSLKNIILSTKSYALFEHILNVVICKY